ncbi:MAG: hypothetical protein KGP28_10580 [Bdellovibrionales bacterium]|nr:hypothetical protein [Bdellovibrionales bacterium]
MKSFTKPLLFAISLVALFSASHARAENELDAWAKKKVEETLKGCSHRSSKEVFTKLKTLEVEYSAKADQAPPTFLKRMSMDSEFIEMGQVIFPAMLPRGFPARLIYMACDEEHRAFIESKPTTESKENLLELKDCFRRNYRIETPKMVSVLIQCYEDLPD